MRSTQYPEDVILNFLREAASGTPIDHVCSTARISTRTFYRWRAQYGGLTLAAARERNDLLHENARLRALLHESWRQHSSWRRADQPAPSDDRPRMDPFRSEIGTRSASPANPRQGCSSGRFASVRTRR